MTDELKEALNDAALDGLEQLKKLPVDATVGEGKEQKNLYEATAKGVKNIIDAISEDDKIQAELEMEKQKQEAELQKQEIEKLKLESENKRGWADFWKGVALGAGGLLLSGITFFVSTRNEKDVSEHDIPDKNMSRAADTARSNAFNWFKK